MGAALQDPENWTPEAFEPTAREQLADAIVREQGRVVAAALAFSVRTFLSPIWAQGVEDGVAEGLLPDAVSLVLGNLEAERASPLREARQGGGISLQDSDFGGRYRGGRFLFAALRYSPDQARDENGRWTEEEGRGGGGNYETAPPGEFTPINDTDKYKVQEIAADMEANGWVGKPLLIINGEAWTGSHRLAAAKEAGIDVKVQRFEIPEHEIKYQGDPYDDDARLKILEGIKADADEPVPGIDAAILLMQEEVDSNNRSGAVATVVTRAADNPGPIRRKDLDRVQRYIRQTWREASIDLQSKTLEEPFLSAAGDTMRTAAREKWGKDRFLAEIDRLADEYGAAGFRGSYAATWHRTAVVNQSWNNGVLLMYGAEPTRRLYPYLILYTMEDDRVRDNHFALNRVVARSSWEGWQRYAPPLGWNCRCRLAPVSYVVAQASGWIDEEGNGEDFPNGEPRGGAGRDAGFSLPLVTLPLRRAA